MALGFTSNYNGKSDYNTDSANNIFAVSNSEETTGSIACDWVPSLLSGNEGDACEISAFVPLKIDPSLFASAPAGESAETMGSIAFGGFFSSASSVVSSSGGTSSGGSVSCSSGSCFSGGSSSSFTC